MSETNITIINFSSAVTTAIISANSTNFSLYTKKFDESKIKTCSNYLLFVKDAMVSNEAYALIGNSPFKFTYSNNNETGGGGSESRQRELNVTTEETTNWIINAFFTTPSLDYTNVYDVWWKEEYVKLVSTEDLGFKEIEEENGVEKYYVFSKRFTFKSDYNFKVYISTIGDDNVIYTAECEFDNGKTKTKEFKLTIIPVIDNLNLLVIKANSNNIINNEKTLLTKGQEYIYTIPTGLIEASFKYEPPQDGDEKVYFKSDNNVFQLDSEDGQDINKRHLIYLYNQSVTTPYNFTDYLSLTEIKCSLFKGDTFSTSDFTISATCTYKDIVMTNFQPNLQEDESIIDYDYINFNTKENVNGLEIVGKTIQIKPNETSEPITYQNVYISYEKHEIPLTITINPVQKSEDEQEETYGEKYLVTNTTDGKWLIWKTIDLVGDIENYEDVPDNVKTYDSSKTNFYAWGFNHTLEKYTQNYALQKYQNDPNLSKIVDNSQEGQSHNIDLNEIIDDSGKDITSQYNPAKLLNDGLNLEWRIPTFNEFDNLFRGNGFGLHTIETLTNESNHLKLTIQPNNMQGIYYYGTYNEIMKKINNGEPEDSQSQITIDFIGGVKLDFDEAAYQGYFAFLMNHYVEYNEADVELIQGGDTNPKLKGYYYVVSKNLKSNYLDGFYLGQYNFSHELPFIGARVRCVADFNYPSNNTLTFNITENIYQVGGYLYYYDNASVTNIQDYINNTIGNGDGTLGWKLTSKDELQYFFDRCNIVVENENVLFSNKVKDEDLPCYSYDINTNSFTLDDTKPSTITYEMNNSQTLYFYYLGNDYSVCQFKHVDDENEVKFNTTNDGENCYVLLVKDING